MYIVLEPPETKHFIDILTQNVVSIVIVSNGIEYFLTLIWSTV